MLIQFRTWEKSKGSQGQDAWITGSGHWKGQWRLQSLVTRVHGVTVCRSHLGAHCPATPQSWMGRLPAARSSSPATSRPQSGEEEDAGPSSSAPRVSREFFHPCFCPDSAQSSLLPCSLTFPFLCPSAAPTPTPSLHTSLTQGLRPKPLITSSPHLLYHFHSLPSLQLQLVCLLWDVVEVHLAPSLGAPRFGRATWGQTREKERPLEPRSPVP